MGDLGYSYLLSSIVTALPMLVVTVAGMAFVVARRRAVERSAGLAIAGCVVLTFGTVGNVAWLFVYPRLLFYGGYSVVSLGAASLAIGLVLALIHATGVGLLIGAVLASGRAPEHPSPYQP